ncbi:MAG: DNA-processing protein DprA [Planctomycetota bacterium]|nr:DNA-processing protein DprA [Planctomycetota bacterium]MDA1162887.1 DNA-processing protein DprA [Planctomycetota bacterium]
MNDINYDAEPNTNDEDFSESDAALVTAIRLNLVPGIGPRHQRSLLDYFGDPESIFAASLTELERVSGVGPKLARLIHAARTTDHAESEVRTCQQHGYRLLRMGTDEYPENLTEVCDAPLILYCRGELKAQDNLAVGIVGSRRCTLYGTQQAERFGRALAMAGITVVSGLARGIDAAAHRGALAAGGRTIAVSATGLNHIYPPEHVELAEQISKNGAVVCESRLDQQPTSGIFPQRNRIISGLSLGVVIIEANRKSGALHTARHAMEQGREVMAIPGRIDSFASDGCNDLIRDGATLIRNVDDVIEALGPLVEPVQTEDQQEVRSPRELTLSTQERLILDMVTSEPQHLDEIIRTAEIGSSRVLATLTVLEMKRMVKRLPGGFLVRAFN